MVSLDRSQRRQQAGIGNCAQPFCTNPSVFGSRYCKEHQFRTIRNPSSPDRLEQGGKPKHTLRDQLDRIEDKLDRVLGVNEEDDEGASSE